MQKKNLFTVIIPVCNAGEHFNELLEKIKKQNSELSQTLVIDSGSTDGSLQMARNHDCSIIIIAPSDFDHGTTRNLAVAKISSEFIVFLTQDVIPADEYMIEELIKPMQADPNIAICYGRQLPMPNADPLEQFARDFNYPAQAILKTKNDIETLGIKTFFCSNSCAAYRRSIFEKLGGFEDGVGTNEDMLLAAKAITAGYSVYYSADARVYHSHNYTLPSLWTRYFAIGRFFARHAWLLETAPPDREGVVMFKQGMSKFWRKRQVIHLLWFTTQTLIKTLAFKFGWYYQLLFKSKSKQ